MKSSGQAVRPPILYEDFPIQITPDGSGGYLAQVLFGPPGPSEHIRWHLPYSPDQLPALLNDLEVRVRGSRLPRCLGVPGKELRPTDKHPLPGLAQEVGDALYRALFCGRVREEFLSCRTRLSQSGKGLRIRLIIDPSLAGNAIVCALPWELVFQEETGAFIGLDHMTPLVRQLLVSSPIDPYPGLVKPPLRILIAVASPRGLVPLELEWEQELISSALAKRDAEIEISVLKHATDQALRERLRDFQPHVLHFMGHGDFKDADEQGCLILEMDDGAPDRVAGKDLVLKLLGIGSLRLVVLNACDSGRHPREGLDPYSSVAAALLRGGMPSVVSMQFPISDPAALAFSRAFYRAVAAGDPIDAAMSEARQGIYSSDRQGFEWATPVLYLRLSSGELIKSLEAAGQTASIVFPRQISMPVAVLLVRQASKPGFRDSIIEHLAQALDTRPDPAERYWIYMVLGNLGGERARSLIEDGLDDEHGFALLGVQRAQELLDSKQERESEEGST